MQATEAMKRAGMTIAAAALIAVPAAGQTQGSATSPPPAPASGAPVIYPAKGQTAEQMQKDKGECYTWATQQSGYDPVAAAQQAQAAQGGTGSSSSGGAVKGGAKGAAAGAAIGAVAGDPGKGAAIGATAGGVGGAAKKRKQETAQKDAAAQQQQETSQKLAGYNKAFAACMEGRNYTVK
jgi:hypothetical protein